MGYSKKIFELVYHVIKHSQCGNIIHFIDTDQRELRQCKMAFRINLFYIESSSMATLNIFGHQITVEINDCFTQHRV